MNQRNTNVDFKSLELFPIEAYTDYSHGMTPISTRTKVPRHEQTHARAKAQIRPKRTPIAPGCPDRPGCPVIRHALG